MTRFYQPDLSTDLDSPFIRDGEDKLIRRSYWLDMDDRTLVMVMVYGIGTNLTNDEKRAHLIDLRREHLIDKVCIQEILPRLQAAQTSNAWYRSSWRGLQPGTSTPSDSRLITPETTPPLIPTTPATAPRKLSADAGAVVSD